MPEEISIRPCAPEEAPQLLQFWREATVQATVTDNLQGVGVLLEQHGDAVLLALADGRIVGSVVAAFDGWRGNIYRLAVDPRLKRQGIATRLMAEAERRLVAQGAKRLAAVVDSQSTESVPFWEAMASQGWTASHPGVRYVKSP